MTRKCSLFQCAIALLIAIPRKAHLVPACSMDEIEKQYQTYCGGGSHREACCDELVESLKFITFLSFGNTIFYI